MNEIILNYVRHNLELLAIAHSQPEKGKMNTYEMVMIIPIDYQNPQTLWNVLFSAKWLDKLSERDILIQLYKQIQNQNPFSNHAARNGQSIHAFRPILTKNSLVKHYRQSLRVYNGFDVAVYSGDENIPIGYVIESKLLENLFVGNTIAIQVKERGIIKGQITELTKQSVVIIDNNPYSDKMPKNIEYIDIVDIERPLSLSRQYVF